MYKKIFITLSVVAAAVGAIAHFGHQLNLASDEDHRAPAGAAVSQMAPGQMTPDQGLGQGPRAKLAD